MGREGIWLDQLSTEPVDIARWRPDEEFAVYPEGARDKSLIYSPDPAPYGFLVADHRYLFKHAFNRYPDQFWAEIIAYRIGCLLSVAVPPAFVAWDSDAGTTGALIEWFLDYPGAPVERYVPGGDIMASVIRGYDRKRGRQHNFEAIERYLRVLERGAKIQGDWLDWWCDALLFDALIGNTDRHQDNWGLLWTPGGRARMAPVFDNGTSLGHEIIPAKIPGFEDPERMARYIDRGRHHMRWSIADDRRAPHSALVRHLLERWPDLGPRVGGRLNHFSIEAMRATIMAMMEFAIPVPLTALRAGFVCDLTEARYRALVRELPARP